MVAHMKRFHKAFRRAKQLIEEGELGRVFHVRSDWDEPAQEWSHGGSRGDERAWGGHFQDHGPHTVDLCIWWLGDAVRVRGTIRLVNPLIRNEDLAVAVVEHAGGAVSVHQTCIYTFRQWFETYEIYGTEGTLVIDGRRHTSWSVEPPTMTLYKGPLPHIGHAGERVFARALDVTPYNIPNQLDETLAHHQYLLEIEHFCECVRTGREPAVTTHDSRKTIEAVNALYLSAHSRRAVDLPLEEQPDLPAIFAEGARGALRFSV
jgi:predicted dehydrogenase